MVTVQKTIQRVFPLGLFFLLLFTVHLPLFAQTPTETQSPTPTPDSGAEEQAVKDKVRELETKINELKGQEKTFSQQISVMDSQIVLTQYRMNATAHAIAELDADIDTANKKIQHLESSLTDLSKVLIRRIVSSYETGETTPLHLFISSPSTEHFLARENYLKVIQAHDRELLLQTEQAKNDYAHQQEIFEDKKKRELALKQQLEAYTRDLDTQKAEKQRLLEETKGSEANYQRLLAQAKAQLAGFSRFTASQGGASLLSGQTVCDDWGCYYNQRDSQWGNNALNGTQFTLASDGCLVTSMAMVYTHYGRRGVTPQTINSNSSNFASYYPAYLNFAISADGVNVNRVRVSQSEMDSELAVGRPIVVGISYDSGPIADHFIVIISGSNGEYRMNDPYTPNGRNIPLTDKYSAGSIRERYKVVGF